MSLWTNWGKQATSRSITIDFYWVEVTRKWYTVPDTRSARCTLLRIPKNVVTIPTCVINNCKTFTILTSSLFVSTNEFEYRDKDSLSLSCENFVNNISPLNASKVLYHVSHLCKSQTMSGPRQGLLRDPISISLTRWPGPGDHVPPSRVPLSRTSPPETCLERCRERRLRPGSRPRTVHVKSLYEPKLKIVPSGLVGTKVWRTSTPDLPVTIRVGRVRTSSPSPQ